MSVSVQIIREGVVNCNNNLRSAILNLDDEPTPTKYSNINGGGNVHLLDDERRKRECKILTVKIANIENIPEPLHDDFFNHMDGAVQKFKTIIAQKDLPNKPLREFEHGENVIDYIRADDGLGPWVAANALNRPLILKLAPGAYYALANYLRRNELPADLSIPKKSEALETEEITPESVKAARRLLSRVERQKRSGHEMS